MHALALVEIVHQRGALVGVGGGRGVTQQNNLSWVST